MSQLGKCSFLNRKQFKFTHGKHRCTVRNEGLRVILVKNNKMFGLDTKLENIGSVIVLEKRTPNEKSFPRTVLQNEYRHS